MDHLVGHSGKHKLGDEGLEGSWDSLSGQKIGKFSFLPDSLELRF